MNPFPAPVAVFLRSRLGRRMLGVLLAVLTVCSLLFLAIFTTAYRDRLIDEHARASMQVNRLLEASLKNAMLKRDIPGLRGIIAELGRQKDIAGVYVLNPEGEVRFTTTDTTPDRILAGPVVPSEALSMMVVTADQRDVLRTINPVANEPRCQACHGDVAEHPVNGILVVDYAAGDVRREAWRGAVLMGLAGGAVLLMALGAVALLLYGRVLRPLDLLSRATTRFVGGDFSTRLALPGSDEVALLGSHFNGMAGSIETMIRALRTSEDFLQRIIDAMPDGVRVIAADYTILKVNAAYCRQLGITAEQALGRPCHASSHHLDAPCSARLVTCPLEELKGGRISLKCRHRHLRADGSELFVEVTAAAMLEHDGAAVPCVIESIRDQADQAEVSHQHRLSEIGQIAAGIAHEIHNPLSSIHLALGAIASGSTGSSGTTELDSYIEIANREIDRCLDVTRRLLRISEPAGTETLLLDAGKLVADVVALVAYQARQAKVDIRLEIAGRPRVLVNESDMGIVVLNIVQNAIHAMPGGGTLTISAAADGQVVRFDFADTGVGISKENLHRIFWPFWSKRADGSSGSGLGLSICCAAVDRMGGTISVGSEPGVGTVIHVGVPDADRREDQL